MSAPLDLRSGKPPIVVVVGSGGVGKTTLAAALGLISAQEGVDSLVMTFDPSLRLKDALGVGKAAEDEEIAVALPPGSQRGGVLNASLLDARRTFDRLVERYTESDEQRERILGNHYYQHLAGHLGGILEYMAVERLYEVAKEERYGRLVLDTPPTAQAIDFLEAPQRITSFLDSGALKIALKPWFNEEGHLRGSFGLNFLAKGIEQFLDKIVGMQLLRDMSEFFRAFEPMFAGFHARALEVEKLLRSPEAVFVLVTGPRSAHSRYLVFRPPPQRSRPQARPDRGQPGPPALRPERRAPLGAAAARRPRAARMAGSQPPQRHHRNAAAAATRPGGDRAAARGRRTHHPRSPRPPGRRLPRPPRVGLGRPEGGVPSREAEVQRHGAIAGRSSAAERSWRGGDRRADPGGAG